MTECIMPVSIIVDSEWVKQTIDAEKEVWKSFEGLSSPQPNLIGDLILFRRDKSPGGAVYNLKTLEIEMTSTTPADACHIAGKLFTIEQSGDFLSSDGGKLKNICPLGENFVLGTARGIVQAIDIKARKSLQNISIEGEVISAVAHPEGSALLLDSSRILLFPTNATSFDPVKIENTNGDQFNRLWPNFITLVSSKESYECFGAETSKSELHLYTIEGRLMGKVPLTGEEVTKVSWIPPMTQPSFNLGECLEKSVHEAADYLSEREYLVSREGFSAFLAALQICSDNFQEFQTIKNSRQAEKVIRSVVHWALGNKRAMHLSAIINSPSMRDPSTIEACLVVLIDNEDTGLTRPLHTVLQSLRNREKREAKANMAKQKINDFLPPHAERLANHTKQLKRLEAKSFPRPETLVGGVCSKWMKDHDETSVLSLYGEESSPKRYELSNSLKSAAEKWKKFDQGEVSVDAELTPTELRVLIANQLFDKGERERAVLVCLTPSEDPRSEELVKTLLERGETAAAYALYARNPQCKTFKKEHITALLSLPLAPEHRSQLENQAHEDLTSEQEFAFCIRSGQYDRAEELAMKNEYPLRARCLLACAPPTDFSSQDGSSQLSIIGSINDD